MGKYKREISVAIAYFALLAVLAIFAPLFYQGNKFLNIMVSSAYVLVAAVGMTLVILSRNIDISIGSQLSICGVFAALLAKSGMPMPLVAVVTMAIGAGMGAVNGALVAFLRLPSIVVTLATMVILREALRWWRQGELVYLPPGFQWFGMGQTTGQLVIIAIALIVFLLFAWGLRYISAGRAVYAAGSDPDAAYLVGVRPQRVVFLVMTLMGALTGLAALLNGVRLPLADPLAGNQLELQVIAAVVVGGVAISGGRGILLGVLFGVILLGTIGSALSFLGGEAYWEKAVQGAIILIAVASDAFDLKRRKHAGAALAHQ